MKTLVSAARGGKLPFRGRALLRAAAVLDARCAPCRFADAIGRENKSAATPAAVAASDPVLKAMQSEIARATAELGKTEQPPYYLSYTVYARISSCWWGLRQFAH